MLFSQVAVLDFTEQQRGDVWLPARVSDVVALKLRLLGLDVRDRRFARAVSSPREAGLEAVVWGRVRPANAEEESERISIEVKVKPSAGDERLIRVEGRAGELDRLAADIAIQVAKLAGRPVDPEVRALLASTASHPFAVHAFLGRAERRLEAGDHLQAMVMFDRAGSFANRGAIPEAWIGRQRAEGARVAQGAAELGSRAELATSAAERAQVALRDGDREGARRALADVLRYTTARALRWSAELHLGGPDRAVIVGRDKRWLVQVDAGPTGLWALHPATGTILSVSPGKKGLLGAAGNDLLTLQSRVLARQPPAGAIAWKVALPLEPIADLWERALLSQGSLGLLAHDGVVWVDVGLGALGQVATHVEPLAQSPSGILVKSEGELALLRPGKKTPAWRVKPGAIEGAALTAERALALGSDQLAIISALDGKLSKTLPAPKGGRILRAYGRFACVAGDDGVHLYDILAAEKTAVLIGPGRAIDCTAESDGVSVLYASGDLLSFNRDGKLLERARAPGKVERLLRATPITPGPVVVGDQGLIAFAEITMDPLLVDIDAAMRLAELERDRGDAAAALRLADWVALTSAGQVAKAEHLRAALLKSMKQDKAAAAAERRAKAAENPATALPAFSLW